MDDLLHKDVTPHILALPPDVDSIANCLDATGTYLDKFPKVWTPLLQLKLCLICPELELIAEIDRRVCDEEQVLVFRVEASDPSVERLP